MKQIHITPSDIYTIDQLEAIRMAQVAWNEVNTTTIQNCWRKAGILPTPPALPSFEQLEPTVPISSLIHSTDSDTAATTLDCISHTKTLITTVLDKLEATGALQHSNQMDIPELLNPAIETNNIFGATNEDIYNSMMEARKLKEQDGLGDGDDVDTPELVLTRWEALQAAFILKRYLSTFNDDLLFAHKLEVMVGLFGQQTWVAKMQGMIETKLTDFFARR